MLIKKEDFHTLVANVVHRLPKEEFNRRFKPRGMPENTVIDLMAAAYWPRVRLLEWWRDGVEFARLRDANTQRWCYWLQMWMLGKHLGMATDDERLALPGKGDEGKIIALFQLRDVSYCAVIPDGYCAPDIVDSLNLHLPVPGLYDGLDAVGQLVHIENILADYRGFEALGFNVVGTSIYVGLCALQKDPVSGAGATDGQKKRLGLSMWLQAMNVKAGVPIVRLRCTIPRYYYPFANHRQKRFAPSFVQEMLTGTEPPDGRRPVFVRCGPQTCCDYLYLYATGCNEWVAIIADAKHTSQPAAAALVTDAAGTSEPSGAGDAVTAEDQEGLYNALFHVNAALQAANSKLVGVRLVFVTNRTTLTEGKKDTTTLAECKERARKEFKVEAELLNRDTFDFGPFSDWLFARARAPQEAEAGTARGTAQKAAQGADA